MHFGTPYASFMVLVTMELNRATRATLKPYIIMVLYQVYVNSNSILTKVSFIASKLVNTSKRLRISKLILKMYIVD